MEDAALPIVYALGFVSGLKHAFEPDHVIAVSTLLHREPKPVRALRTGLAWGAGHTTMLVLAVLLIGLLRLPLSEALLGYVELPVAVMLLGLGGWALYGAAAGTAGLHRHRQDGVNHHHRGDHPRPHAPALRRTGWQGYAVGMVHGLAGSGAMLLLVTVELPSVAAGVGYALRFGIGSVLGMGVVTLALALPLTAALRRPALFHALTGLSGVLGIVLGAAILIATLS